MGDVPRAGIGRILRAVNSRRQKIAAIVFFLIGIFLCAVLPLHPTASAVGILLLTGLTLLQFFRRTTSMAGQLTDVTRRLEKEILDRQQVEATLSASEIQLKTLCDLSSDAIMLLDPEKGFISGNDACIKLFRCNDKNDLFARPKAEMWAPDYQPNGELSVVESRRMMEIAMERGAHSFEWNYKRLNGEEFSANVALARMDIGDKVLLQVTVRDINEQKRAQKSLEESERRLSAIIDFLPDATFAIDRMGRVITWNRAIEEITGVPAAEMLGKGDHAYAVPLYGEPRPILIDLIFGYDAGHWQNYNAIERKGDVIIAERFVPKLRGGNGAYIWGMASPLFDSEGRIVGAIESFRDITEQKQAADALRTSEIMYRSVFNSSIDGIMLRTPDRKVLSANQAAVVMFGYENEKELMAAPLKQLYPERQPDGSLSEEKARRMIGIAQQKGSHVFEWKYNRKDGSPFHAMVELTMLNLADGPVLLNTFRDITEQKLAEAALRASETKYKILYDSSADAITLRTPDRRIVSGNRAAVAMFRCKDESELASLPPETLYPKYQPDGSLSSEKAERVMKTTIRDGSNFLEWRYKRLDGTEFDAMVALKAMYIEGKCFILMSTRDITQQKEAEKALRNSEIKYRTLFDASSDTILLRTPDRRIVGANRSAVSLFGYADENELMAVSPADLYSEYQPDGCLSSEKAQKMVEIAFRDGSHFFEWKYKRKDGSEFLANVLWTVMELEGKKILLTTIRDITERRRAENERKLSTERMESLLRLSHMADKPMDEIIAVAMEDAIRMTQSTIGYLAMVNDDESVLTMRYWSKSAHADCKIVDKPIVYPLETTGLWGEAIRQRQPIVTNDYAAPNPLKHGAPEGHVPLVRHMNIPVFNGQHIVAVAGVGNKPADYDERDLRQLQLLMEGWWRIVMHKQYELELAQARDEAQAANHAKSRFLATMSHEIRTPLTAILGYAELLMDPSINSSSRHNYAATIRRSGEHLLTIINDILDLSKIEAGKMTINMAPCRLISILADVASLLRPKAKQQGVSFSIEYEGPIPETIQTDAARLRQTILNLAGNSVKFTEKGCIRIVTSLLPQGCDDQPAVKIDVIDTGIGISNDVLPRLFLPFSQGDASVSRKYGGTGLGLAISHHIAQLLGGSLTVSSELEHGSTFTLIVPTGSLDGVPMLEDPGEAMEEGAGKSWTPEAANLTGLHILLAEDGFDNRMLITTILRRAGAEVETAEDGRVAVEKASQTPFDLILMDMNMPEMDGYEATRVLRDRGYEGPILALTANAMSGDRERCHAAGCDEYLAKPIDRALLIRTIANFAMANVLHE